jgi:hypothetical protein
MSYFERHLIGTLVAHTLVVGGAAYALILISP